MGVQFLILYARQLTLCIFDCLIAEIIVMVYNDILEDLGITNKLCFLQNLTGFRIHYSLRIFRIRPYSRGYFFSLIIAAAQDLLSLITILFMHMGFDLRKLAYQLTSMITAVIMLVTDIVCSAADKNLIRSCLSLDNVIAGRISEYVIVNTTTAIKTVMFVRIKNT